MYRQLIRHTGIQPLFQAIEMSILAACNDYPLHLHTEGLRGTGKTTVIRSARHILPPITRIKGCIYNCHPARPHCPLHRHLTAGAVRELGVETVPRPFLEISHSAKPGSIVGSIDLAKLTGKDGSVAALLPGTIPQAHRGIIFIDEINRLADIAPELADILLDVMGTKPGRIQIEEPGLPVIELPVSVSIWAASNPDEAPGPLRQIRRQLSDRFDLTVPVSKPATIHDVVGILKNRRTAGCGPLPIPRFDYPPLEEIEVPDGIRSILAAIYINHQLESLRSIEAVEMAACLAALFDAQPRVTLDQISRVIPFALGHRTDSATMAKISNYLDTLRYGDLLQTSHSATVPAQADNRPPLKHRQETWRQKLWSLLSRTFRQTAPADSPGKLPPHLSKSAEIIAPPDPAIPLSQLTDRQLITLPDCRSHD